MCHVQNAEQIYYVKMANKSFDSVKKLKYLGMTLKQQYCVREEMKNRLSSAKPANMRSKISCFLFSFLKHVDQSVRNYKSVCCIIWM